MPNEDIGVIHFQHGYRGIGPGYMIQEQSRRIDINHFMAAVGVTDVHERERVAFLRI